jgi:hypothetical protein
MCNHKGVDTSSLEYDKLYRVKTHNNEEIIGALKYKKKNCFCFLTINGARLFAGMPWQISPFVA